MLPLPRTLNPAHMRENAAVDFVISDTDKEALREVQNATDYGEAGSCPSAIGRRRSRPNPTRPLGHQ